MLRISQLEPRDRAVTLRLEGRVIGPWVEELRAECDRALAAGAAVQLALDEVSYVDRCGVALLRNLRRRGVALRGCSSFLEEELR